MAVILLGCITLVYKTYELRVIVNGMTVEIMELDLATKEFTCDMERIHAYALGQKEGLKDVNNRNQHD